MSQSDIPTLLLLAVSLAVSAGAEANAQGPSQRAELERQKLELEVAKLRRDRGGTPPWLAGALGVLTGALGAATSFWVARRARWGALDQAVHEKRLERYPDLVEAASALALYFPDFGPDQSSLSPEKCGQIGRAMSRWYFAGGGLLMSVEARDAYFRFARALTRASMASRLNVPVFPGDANEVSFEKIGMYRTELRTSNPSFDDVERWEFGGSTEPHSRFKDYVFLQTLGSDVRTALSEDLRGRRRPS
jgi:hypothetical protein